MARASLAQFLLLNLMSDEIKAEFEQWILSSNSLSIFVSGKTGGGKSALVNNLVGEKVAEEGAEPDPMTTEVTCYKRNINSIDLKVWDSPGLQDGTDNESRYLTDIQTNCADVDLFLFCINISDVERLTLDLPDIQALAKLTNVLGHSLWDNALIALTFANELQITDMEMKKAAKRKNKEKSKELFCDKIREWEEQLREILREIGLDSGQVSNLEIIPTGFDEPDLPDRPHWLSTFWINALRSTRKRAQPALLIMNEARIIENPDTVDDVVCEKHRTDQMLIFGEHCSEIGKRYGFGNLAAAMGVDAADCLHLKTLKLRELILLEQFFMFNDVTSSSTNSAEHEMPVSAIATSTQQSQQDEAASPVDIPERSSTGVSDEEAISLSLENDCSVDPEHALNDSSLKSRSRSTDSACGGRF